MLMPELFQGAGKSTFVNYLAGCKLVQKVTAKKTKVEPSFDFISSATLPNCSNMLTFLTRFVLSDLQGG